MVQGIVYVGGGVVESFSDNNDYIVMEYNTRSGKWGRLPPYRLWNFAMTVINSASGW